MIDTFADVSSILLLAIVIYWMRFLDKNKNDERGDQIVGKAAKISFSSLFIIMAFISIFLLQRKHYPRFPF